MEVLGLLRIRVLRGINLAIRDTLKHSSDPYVVITMGHDQKVKSSVKRRNCNPVWNDELTLSIHDLNVPIDLKVYDEDTFTGDDEMGEAKIDIKPLVECLTMGLEGLPNGVKVGRMEPNKENCLSDESFVVWENGKMKQDMTLKLKNVECGEVEIQIEWVDVGGSKSLHNHLETANSFSF